MNDEVGRTCRPASRSGFRGRGEERRARGRILVVDPVLGSRLALAEAVAQPDFEVETAHGFEEALRHFEQGPIALVIVDLELGERDGFSLLKELRTSHPDTVRALVTAREGAGFTRRAIEQADLAFVLRKPWKTSMVRRTVRDVLEGLSARRGWSRLEAGAPRSERGERSAGDPVDATGRSEILLRGLLAGLNSCEFETQLFELLHTELSATFGVHRWLWVDEDDGHATRIVGDWPVEAGLAASEFSAEEARAVELARRSLRITRLDEIGGPMGQGSALARVGLAIRHGARRSLSGVIWVDRRDAAGLIALFRNLDDGLQNAFRRIRDAEARARAARTLAQRVSEELRRPVGALTHAVDLLRGEAERVGMPAEWMDRISSESQRVMEAVEHLEGEMLPELPPLVSSSR